MFKKGFLTESIQTYKSVDTSCFVPICANLFQDIKSKLNTPRQLAPIAGINFTEILYADDTLLFGSHTQTINTLLQEVQQESAQYNMRLNLAKCVNLTINRTQSSVRFLDGSLVPRQYCARYLGSILNEAADNTNEIKSRIGETVGMANKLQLFWSKANTTIKWKLRVLDAVLLSKLMYGLDTMQLTKNELQKLDSFQMKMLRRILSVPPTFVDRQWTNQKVLDTLLHRYAYTHHHFQLDGKLAKSFF